MDNTQYDEGVGTSTEGDESFSTVEDIQSHAQEVLKQNIANSKKSFLVNLVEAHNEVMAEFSKIWHQLVVSGPSMLQDFKEFVSAIDWSERWIQAILAVQACILLTLVLFRNNMVVQNTIFAMSVVVIYKADAINAWGAQHWEDFARHNYFERNGAFVSAVVSAPLLFGMLIVLINLAVHFMQTLVVMKTEQLKKKKTKKNQ